ncbi:8031_t:CDS:2 [Funneliformis geosporum]|uniref:8031_t:CDS:1 n=1 Tax=Funneliformis geosporum TaxID=1117311 RepID=A0A9W4SJX0_9GLOM|nr:8031_t:CDS:2 [Funneliformis geosporum]
MSLIGDTFGEDFYNKIIEHIAKEREAMKSFQAIKDEKGLELKCSFCEIVIKGSSELKIDADFFKALDKNFYCADCYEKKYPQEFSEKYQKVSQQNQTQTRVEITGSESEEIDKTESADSSKENSDELKKGLANTLLVGLEVEVLNDEKNSLEKKLTEMMKKSRSFIKNEQIRDKLLGIVNENSDIDIATSCPIQEIPKLFSDVVYVGMAFGVCIVKIKDEVDKPKKKVYYSFDVATFRRDGIYQDLVKDVPNFK